MHQVASTKPNRLIQEKSPYLIQHAYNPVDWFPWGEEAFDRAREENKLIFLSIGYSACHWCHVMERETFEDPSMAELLNTNFVNIKVDREERPDIDQIYMTAVQMMAGSGGWPLSVWLTPDLKPFYGGSYFPPDDRFGRPGFKSILLEIISLWRTEKGKIEKSAQKMTEALLELKKQPSEPLPGPVPVRELLHKAFRAVAVNYDSLHGGFGPAPKFPMPATLQFLLTAYGLTKNPAALDMVVTTIKKMAQGGIHDQLGGGFARYSTDEKWRVPHFEKMLYDNAQIISLLARIYQLTHDHYFQKLAHRTVQYIFRELTHFEGGFYSSEDADSAGREGAFYLWTKKEIEEYLNPEEGRVAIDFYGVQPNGNFQSPTDEGRPLNILFQAGDIEDTARRSGLSLEAAQALLEAARQKLLAARSLRTRPDRDEKIITEWNGLMISALAQAGAAFHEPSYLTAAEKAAVFIRRHLSDQNGTELFRHWKDGERKIPAFQTDYAFLVQGLLDLFEATGHVHWLQWASQLDSQMNELFFDPKNPGYFLGADSNDILIRLKDDADQAMFSGNAVAVQNGVRLSRFLGRLKIGSRTLQTIRSYAGNMKSHPASYLGLIMAAALATGKDQQIMVIGPLDRPDTQQLLRTVYETWFPHRIIHPVQPGVIQNELSKLNPMVAYLTMHGGMATAYLCEDFACQNPTTDPDEFTRQLQAASSQKSF